MAPVRIAEGIYWVGAIDWNLRQFHGYATRFGTTYNAYLIVDDRVALVDTVKAPFYAEMRQRIAEIIDPGRIDFVISNHAEMDHSGSIPLILKETPRAKLVTLEKAGEAALAGHFHVSWPTLPVNEGTELSLGQRKLRFVPMPMVHWPENMATYLPDEGIIFPSDAFGQHFATSRLLDDEVDLANVMSEARKYFATIVHPYLESVRRVLDRLSGLNIKTIAPSHGIIWRSHTRLILDAYAAWVKGPAPDKALIVYDTMWHSTEQMAQTLAQGLSEAGVQVRLYPLADSDPADVMADLLEARAVLVGSATQNNGVLPTVAAFLCRLKGVKGRGRLGLAFGSYGWGGGAVRTIEAELKAAGLDVQPGLSLQLTPDKEGLERCLAQGKALAQKMRETASVPSS